MVRLSGYASSGVYAVAFYTNNTFAGLGRFAWNSLGGVYYSGDEYLVPKDATYRFDCYQCWGSALTYWHELR
jgi:hypothetical protein